MHSIGDILDALARQRGRGDASPLIALRTLDPIVGERISHFPADQTLAQAWQAMTSEPFRPHHSQALTSIRRGDAVALMASVADVTRSALLMVYALLTDAPSSAALLLANDRATAWMIHSRLTAINAQLPAPLRCDATLLIDDARDQRPSPFAKIIIATPEMLHGRLLRHHERAWRTMWERLGLVVLFEAQQYGGIAGAHIADLVVRLARVAAHHGAPDLRYLATVQTMAEPDAALAHLIRDQWRLIGADDMPHPGSTFAIWQGTNSRLRESWDLAQSLQRQGYHVHLVCTAVERLLLLPLIGDTPGVSFGPDAPAVQILIQVGAPATQSALHRMQRSAARAVIVVLGDTLVDQAVARHVDLLVSGQPTAWPRSSINSYVTVQHLLCAANELPLTGEDIEQWGVQEIVNRLVRKGDLLDLPDPEVAFTPAAHVGDPYAEVDLLTSSGAAVLALNEIGAVVTQLDPTGLERWMYLGAALPLGSGGAVVKAHNDEQASITLRMESNGRRTYPLRRATIELRDTLSERALAGGRPIGFGRGMANETIYAYREHVPQQQPQEVTLRTPGETAWLAHLCWIDLPVALTIQGQLVGWSVAAALSMRANVAITDIISCYVPDKQRIVFADVQPGGSGLARWLYDHAEQILPLAYDIALACRADPLLEPLGRNDQDWLLFVLGSSEPALGNLVGRAADPRAPEIDDQPSVLYIPPRAASPADPPRTPPRAAIPPARSAEPPARPAEPPRVTPPAARAPETPSARPAEPPRVEPPRMPPRDNTGRQRSLFPESGARPAEPKSAPHEPSRPSEPPARPPEPPARYDSPRQPPPAPDRATGSPARPEPPARQPEPPKRAPELPRYDPPRQPPARQEPQAEPAPDAAALLARLRRMRQQQEAQTPPARPTPPQRRADGPNEHRFAPGDRVFCLPYGDGAVEDAWFELDGRELLTVSFAQHGSLQIDPAVSLVRKTGGELAQDDDLL